MTVKVRHAHWYSGSISLKRFLGYDFLYLYFSTVTFKLKKKNFKNLYLKNYLVKRNKQMD